VKRSFVARRAYGFLGAVLATFLASLPATALVKSWRG